ncbi:hypothetical protein [Lactiplantibacillus plantarum]|uniref:hypothetical protein n=1 Tax=Lactiplantibacillus plantarum TaxID=1590 RepID=UPI001BA79E5F|nr:hypothetical protein [Lactiplantibacillus plantarum]MBS0954985.1 hypothetical protein [Lactiplantibacillus plantarum]
MSILLIIIIVITFVILKKRKPVCDEEDINIEEDKVVNSQEAFERTRNPSYIAVYNANEEYSKKLDSAEIEIKKNRTASDQFKKDFSAVLSKSNKRIDASKKKEEGQIKAIESELPSKDSEFIIVDEDGQKVTPEDINGQLNEIANAFNSESQLEKQIQRNDDSHETPKGKISSVDKRDLQIN